MKNSYTFKHTRTSCPQDPVPPSVVVLEVECVTLSELLEHFGYFLKACGYSFDGHVDVVSDEE